MTRFMTMCVVAVGLLMTACGPDLEAPEQGLERQSVLDGQLGELELQGLSVDSINVAEYEHRQYVQLFGQLDDRVVMLVLGFEGDFVQELEPGAHEFHELDVGLGCYGADPRFSYWEYDGRISDLEVVVSDTPEGRVVEFDAEFYVDDSQVSGSFLMPQDE